MWAGGKARPELCRPDAGQGEVGGVFGRGRQVKSYVGRLKAVAVFILSLPNCFPPCRALALGAGVPVSGSRTPQCPGRSMGHLRKARQAGSLVPWESSCRGRQGRRGSPGGRARESLSLCGPFGRQREPGHGGEVLCWEER